MTQSLCLSETHTASLAGVLARGKSRLPSFEYEMQAYPYRQGPSPSAERQGAGWYPRETCVGGQQEGLIYQACVPRGARVIMSALK